MSQPPGCYQTLRMAWDQGASAISTSVPTMVQAEYRWVKSLEVCQANNATLQAIATLFKHKKGIHSINSVMCKILGGHLSPLPFDAEEKLMTPQPNCPGQKIQGVSVYCTS